jgi:D-sedoheptulose 7-phosphate isomerase
MYQESILKQIEDHIEVSTLITDERFVNQINFACKLAIDAITRGNKILIFGNGGSAADAQHIAAEFTGRFVKERKGLPAIALTTDTSAITSIGNDYGFDRIFDRQIEALANPGDLLIGISTSGNSLNIVNGLKKGKEYGCKLLGFTGNDGGLMNNLCDVNLIVNILIGHILCSAIDDSF